MFVKTSNVWTDRKTITCHFMEGSSTQRHNVEREAKKWEQYQGLRFNFTDDPNANVRIKFQKTGGCWACFGNECLRVPTNRHTVNFSWLNDSTSDENYKRAVLHEFGHVLGAGHELQSPSANISWNRDAVYKYYTGPPCKWSKEYVNINVFGKYPEDQCQYTSFDPKSIMMYPVPKEFTIDGFSVGWNSDLSDTDKNFIATIYP
jgi:hypothetical protein